MKEATYWLDPHPAAKNYSNKPLPPKTDVLVVGSGYTGVATALQLKKVNVDIHEYVEAQKVLESDQRQSKRHAKRHAAGISTA
jgi:glycine/D-amino acid oxidase-like deaminating enzyme